MIDFSYLKFDSKNRFKADKIVFQLDFFYS